MKTYDLLPQFKYFDTLLLNILKQWEILDWDTRLDAQQVAQEYNLSGGRYSTKTFSMCIFCAKLISLSLRFDKKVGIYAYRKLGSKLNEISKDLISVLDNYKIKYSLTKNPYYYIEFSNGSFIKIGALYDNQGRYKLKGENNINGYHTAILWCEEANELSSADKHQIRLSSGRGAKEKYFITICNPDTPNNEHINYLIQYAPFDKGKLISEGTQYTLTKSKNSLKRFFHYSNYKINPFLDETTKLHFDELMFSNHELINPWVIGLPAKEEGSIFGDYLQYQTKLKEFIPYEYFGGLDLAFSTSYSGHCSVATLVSCNSEHNSFYIDSEWVYKRDPYNPLSVKDMCNEIIKFYLNELDMLGYQRPIIIRVDTGGRSGEGGGLPIIDLLNDMANTIVKVNNYGTTYLPLKFVGVDKTLYYIKDRIEAIQMLLASRRLGWDENRVPKFNENLNLMSYNINKLDKSSKVLIYDKNDDAFDSVCYAIMPFLKDIFNSGIWKDIYKVREINYV